MSVYTGISLLKDSERTNSATSFAEPGGCVSQHGTREEMLWEWMFTFDCELVRLLVLVRLWSPLVGRHLGLLECGCGVVYVSEVLLCSKDEDVNTRLLGQFIRNAEGLLR